MQPNSTCNIQMPRKRRINWMSLTIKVTRLACIIASTESSNIWMMKASEAVCKHSNALLVNLQLKTVNYE